MNSGRAFICYAIYLAYFYFFVDYDLSFAQLAFPIFVRTFGYMLMSIALLTSFARLPFPEHFTQGLMIQNTFSASMASAIGVAVTGRLFAIKLAKNEMLTSTIYDSVNSDTTLFPTAQIYGEIQKRAMLVSIKEIYGILLIICIICLLILAIRRSDITAVNEIYPKFNTLRNSIRHKIWTRMRHKVMHDKQHKQ